MSLDYALTNPLPVTLADGSVIEITNLGDIEALLTAIGLSSSDIEDAIEGTQETRDGSESSRTYDITQVEIQKEILLELKIIRAHIAEIAGCEITETDI